MERNPSNEKPDVSSSVTSEDEPDEETAPELECPDDQFEEGHPSRATDLQNSTEVHFGAFDDDDDDDDDVCRPDEACNNMTPITPFLPPACTPPPENLGEAAKQSWEEGGAGSDESLHRAHRRPRMVDDDDEEDDEVTSLGLSEIEEPVTMSGEGPQLETQVMTPSASIAKSEEDEYDETMAEVDPREQLKQRELEGLDAARKDIVLVAQVIEKMIKPQSPNLASPIVPYTRKMRTVLVTGATGFLGRMVVFHILSRYDKVVVHCLVRAQGLRANEQAKIRAELALKEAGLWNPIFSARIKGVAGDMHKDRFGMKESSYARLAEAVHAVFHFAGAGDASLSYSKHQPASGICNVIQFCLCIRMKRLHYPSSLLLFPAYLLRFLRGSRDCGETVVMKTSEICESTPVDTEMLRHACGQGHQCGFALKKLVDETCIRNVRQKRKGFVSSIYRLPLMFASGKEPGFTDGRQKNAIARLFGAALRLGVFPRGFMSTWLTSAESATGVIVDIAMNPTPSHDEYHVINTIDRVRSVDLEAWASELGFCWTAVNWEEFMRASQGTKDHRLWESAAAVSSLIPEENPEEIEPSKKITTLSLPVHNALQDLPTDSPWKTGEASECRLLMESAKSTFFRAFISLAQRTTGQKGIVSFSSESPSAPLAVDDLLSTAAARAGGGSLGCHPDVVLLPWKRFFRSVASESSSTFVGRVALRRKVTQALMNIMFMNSNSRVETHVDEKKAFADPVFIIGLHRHGADCLHLMMAEDPKTRCVRRCEMVAPYGYDGQYRPKDVALDASWESDPRMSICRDMINQSILLAADMRNLVTKRTTEPESDDLLFESSGRSLSLAAGLRASEFVQWLLDEESEEIGRGYVMHKRILKHLAAQRPPIDGRWVLRSEQHALSLTSLFETYQNARIIVVHGSPEENVAEMSRMHMALSKSMLEDHRGEPIARTVLDTCGAMSRRLVAFRKQYPKKNDRFIDIHFKNISDNAVGTLAYIYKKLKWPLTAEQMTRFHAFCKMQREVEWGSCKIFQPPRSGSEWPELKIAQADIASAFKSYTDESYSKPRPGGITAALVGASAQARYYAGLY